MFSTSAAPQNALLDDIFSSFLNNECYTEEKSHQHSQHDLSAAFDEAQANCLSQYLENQLDDARRVPHAPTPPRSSAGSSEGSPCALKCSSGDEFLLCSNSSVLEDDRLNKHLVHYDTSSLFHETLPQGNASSILAFPRTADCFPRPHTPSPSPTSSSPSADDTARITKATEKQSTKIECGHMKREPPRAAVSFAHKRPLKQILPMAAPSHSLLLSGPARNYRSVQLQSHFPPSDNIVTGNPAIVDDKALFTESITTTSTIKDEPQSPLSSLPLLQTNSLSMPPRQLQHLTSMLPFPAPCQRSIIPNRRSAAEEKADDDAMARRQERLIKNRAAAILSRKRKRDHIQLLEAQSNELKDETDQLKSRISVLESERDESRMERDEARAERDNAKRELDALSTLLQGHGEPQNVTGQVIKSCEVSDHCVGPSAATPFIDPLSPLKSHELDGEHQSKNERRNVRDNQPKPPKSASVLLMIIFFSLAFWTLPRIDENARLAFKPPIGSSAFYSERVLKASLMDAGLTMSLNNNEESRDTRSLDKRDEKDPVGRCTAADLALWLKRLGTELIGYRIAVKVDSRTDQEIPSPAPSPGVELPASTCKIMSCQNAGRLESPFVQGTTHTRPNSADLPSSPLASATLSCYSSSCPSKVMSAQSESDDRSAGSCDNLVPSKIASVSHHEQVNGTARPPLRIDIQLLGSQDRAYT